MTVSDGRDRALLRYKKKNCIFRFWREYGAVFDHIADDTTVRVVVLSSAMNKAFSAGIDRA